MNRIVEHYTGMIEAIVDGKLTVRTSKTRPVNLSMSIRMPGAVHIFTLHRHEAAIMISRLLNREKIPSGIRYHRAPARILASLAARNFIRPTIKLEQPRSRNARNFRDWDRWWDAVAQSGEWKLTHLGILIAKAMETHIKGEDQWTGLNNWYDLDDDRLTYTYDDYARGFREIIRLGFDVEIITAGTATRGTRIAIRPSEHNYWLRDKSRAEERIGWALYDAYHKPSPDIICLPATRLRPTL